MSSLYMILKKKEHFNKEQLQVKIKGKKELNLHKIQQ